MPPSPTSYYTTTQTDSNNVLSLISLTKSYNKKTVLEDVTFRIVRDDKIVVVGENGVGKSTLLKILTQQCTPDDGRVVLNGTIGYLPQEFTSFEGKTVVECMVQLAEHEELQQFLDEPPDGLAFDPSDAQWQQEFTAAGGYEFLPLLSQLGLDGLDLGQSFDTLSGGQKTKVALAALAVQSPDLLLLDEPTNHLDLQALAWLERFLKQYDGAWVVISHDRTLINNSQVEHIVELTPESHQLLRFKGGYNDYLQAKDKQYIREKLAREQTEQQMHVLSSKLDTAHSSSERRYKFRTDQAKLQHNFNVEKKQNSNAGKVNALQSRMTALSSTMTELSTPRQKISIHFGQSSTLLDDELVIQVKDVSFEYGDNQVLNSVSLDVRSQERVVITGLNGAGKSTLLKLIAGALEPRAGTIRVTNGASIGYLDQEQESITPDMTPVEYCRTETNSKQVLGQLRQLGLIADAGQKLHTLSVGRQRKAQLAKLLLTKPNVLLLDEPTNHIDLQSVEEIEAQLSSFPGVIVAVSHDRTFIEKVATRVVSMESLTAST